MTDQEIIQALIRKDNAVTQNFFFRQCRPLFNSIIGRVFDYEVDYDECINELYIYLLSNDGARLRQFQGRSTLFLWLKVTATRFFIKKRSRMIENASHEPLYDYEEHDRDAITLAAPETGIAAMDVDSIMKAMPNHRYVYVLRRLLLDEDAPETVAQDMNISIDNLYNLKRRALQQLMQVALNDIRHYAKY